jgi:AcrR family transcriptional regulator
MTTGTKQMKESKQEAKKQQIMSAAVELFAEHGFYKTTTAMIAREAGVTQPYIFHFFKTKEELYVAVLEHGFAEIGKVFQEVTAPHDTLQFKMGQAFAQLLKENRKVILLTMQSHTINEEVIRACCKRHFERIHQIVVRKFEEASVENVCLAAATFIGRGLSMALSETLGVPELSPLQANVKKVGRE